MLKIIFSLTIFLLFFNIKNSKNFNELLSIIHQKIYNIKRHNYFLQKKHLYKRYNDQFILSKKNNFKSIKKDIKKINYKVQKKTLSTINNSAQYISLNDKNFFNIIKFMQWKLNYKTFFIENKLFGLRLHYLNKNSYLFYSNNGILFNNTEIQFKKGFINLPIIKNYKISSQFNPKRINPITKKILPHKGVDFATPINTPIFSVSDGKVIKIKKSKTAGKYVTLLHNRKFITRYMHLKKILVKIGQKIKQGDCIGLSGNTGRSTGPHLHYELWLNKKAVDPLKPNIHKQ
ncbi:peptidoglycan DD-metalloendopeptidase family protein [Candidatus Tachikawaea gelatinosa]|uniref:Membrane proteins related to metalloendopeptidases n=1 Tax=Candidatus Tachikawaea gelatinosa TaxID=1410383 RepID=A0A090AS76_9ENTR|nr:peptidoglycan DD-metalloendopeptidase family protein [Candidatus Tachikawaea gelatinosa]BAP58720.1 membrane proteins related to metalloendopeptidases [Candidatus Tachikawaea gelatinosa]